MSQASRSSRSRTSAPFEGSGTTWLPEKFARQIAEALSNCTTSNSKACARTCQFAVGQGQNTVLLGDLILPAKPEMVATVGRSSFGTGRPVRMLAAAMPTAGALTSSTSTERHRRRRVVGEDPAPRSPRSRSATAVHTDTAQGPSTGRLHWQVAAWRAGSPGHPER